MNKKSCLIAVLALLLITVSARAEEGRGYLGGQAGMFLPIKSAVTGTSLGDGTLTYNPGVLLAATGGYRFANGLRGEGELSFRHLTTDKLATGSGRVAADGDISCYGFMTNLYYDIRTPSRVTLYFGAGVGVVGARFGRATSNGATLWTSGSDVAAAYQGIGGFETRLTDSTSLDIVYHHYAVPRLHFQTLSAEFRGLNLSVGLRHWF